MSLPWVAASTRARAVVGRRAGAATVRRVAASPGWQAAREQLAGSAYAGELARAAGPVEVQRAPAGTLLWHLRVLAGWLPPRGHPVVRALAAGFERDAVVDHLRRLQGADVPPAPVLGGLATAWPRLAATRSPGALQAALATSPWGAPGTEDPEVLRDVLSARWVRRVATQVPGARECARSAAALLVARIAVAGTPRPPRLVEDLAALVGRDWVGATTLPQVRAALRHHHAGLRGVDRPEDLWRAEALWWLEVRDTGERLLRSPRSGPEVVVGAVGLLAVDAALVRAALADAVAGRGPGEVVQLLVGGRSAGAGLASGDPGAAA